MAICLLCGRPSTQLMRDSLGRATPMNSLLIDPEEFPFTSEEVYQALRTFMQDAEARSIADNFAQSGPTIVASRAERRMSWKQGGVINAEELPLGAWIYPDQLLTALSALSGELASRVAQLRVVLARRPTYGGAA